MNYLKITLLVFILAACDKVQPDNLLFPAYVHEHVQIIKDNQDLLEKLELSEDKNLEGMVLKNQYQLDVFLNGKEIKNYPSDLYIKKDNTPFYSFLFVADLSWEYKWNDTQLTQNYLEYKLKCPILFEDEIFHVIRIDFTYENREVTHTKISIDGREGKIIEQGNLNSLFAIYPL